MNVSKPLTQGVELLGTMHKDNEKRMGQMMEAMSEISWRRHQRGESSIYTSRSWWRNLEGQIRNRIREQYRIFAKEISRGHGTLVIEDFALREIAKLSCRGSACSGLGS